MWSCGFRGPEPNRLICQTAAALIAPRQDQATLDLAGELSPSRGALRPAYPPFPRLRPHCAATRFVS
jgi:hypothetical protein